MNDGPFEIPGHAGVASGPWRSDAQCTSAGSAPTTATVHRPKSRDLASPSHREATPFDGDNSNPREGIVRGQRISGAHAPRAADASIAATVNPTEPLGDLSLRPGAETPPDINPRKGRGSNQPAGDTQGVSVGTAKKSRGQKPSETLSLAATADEGDGGNAVPDHRFDDPLIQQIIIHWRMRRRWLKAKNALILQGKAFGRSLHDGDKEAGSAAFERVIAGKALPEDSDLAKGLIPFLPAIAAFDKHLGPLERDLERMAKRLPIAAWVASVRGFGFGSLASLVGECGDIGQYRTVSGLWRRLGLAPFKGKAGQTWNVPKWRDGPGLTADEWTEFGYSGERRSVAWNAAEPISRLQRTWIDKKTGEIKKPADPYGAFLEAEKEKALAKGWAAGHAEAHARRVMFKRILRDLWVVWKGVADHRFLETQGRGVGNPNDFSDGHLGAETHTPTAIAAAGIADQSCCDAHVATVSNLGTICDGQQGGDARHSVAVANAEAAQ